jgi:hypothetical protein
MTDNTSDQQQDELTSTRRETMAGAAMLAPLMLGLGDDDLGFFDTFRLINENAEGETIDDLGIDPEVMAFAEGLQAERREDGGVRITHSGASLTEWSEDKTGTLSGPALQAESVDADQGFTDREFAETLVHEVGSVWKADGPDGEIAEESSAEAAIQAVIDSYGTTPVRLSVVSVDPSSVSPTLDNEWQQIVYLYEGDQYIESYDHHGLRFWGTTDSTGSLRDANYQDIQWYPEREQYSDVTLTAHRYADNGRDDQEMSIYTKPSDLTARPTKRFNLQYGRDYVNATWVDLANWTGQVYDLWQVLDGPQGKSPAIRYDTTRIGDSSASKLRLQPRTDGSSNAIVQFLHDTSTTGAREIQIYSGDGSNDRIMTLTGAVMEIRHHQNVSKDVVWENGATSNRPSSPITGQRYFDTDLGQPIWYDGANWVDAQGNSV